MSETADVADLPALLAIWAGKEGSQHILPDLRTRMAAVRQLGALAQAGQTAALEGLVAALTDEDMDITNHAAFFLKNFKNFRQEIILPLLTLLISANSQSQLEIFKVFASIPNLTSLLEPPIRDLLLIITANHLHQSPPPGITYWGPIALLGALDDPLALELIVESLTIIKDAAPAYSISRHFAITALKRHWWRHPSQGILEALLATINTNKLDYTLLLYCLEEIRDPWLTQKLYPLAQQFHNKAPAEYKRWVISNRRDWIDSFNPHYPASSTYFRCIRYEDDVESPTVRDLLNQKKEECLLLTINLAIETLDKNQPADLAHHLLWELGQQALKPILAQLKIDRNTVHRTFFLSVLEELDWGGKQSLIDYGLYNPDPAICQLATTLLINRSFGSAINVLLITLQETERSSVCRKVIVMTLVKHNIIEAIPVLTTLVNTETNSSLRYTFGKALQKLQSLELE